MDPKFLKRIQEAGWQIVHVEHDSAVMGCKREGCGLKSRIKSGAAIPMAASKLPALAEHAVNGFDDARVFLRQRRENLALSIKDVELVAGIAVDYAAKFEKDEPSKIPNVETFIDWAGALGYQVVLRPVELPPYTVRVIAETRTMVKSRIRMARQLRQKRATLRAQRATVSK